MPFDISRARPLLQNGDFCKLFIEALGWEPCRAKLTLRAADRDFAFTAIAEKRGFTAWVCASPDGSLPDHATRLKLDRALTQTSFEHLIVFVTADLDRQLWMWVRREPGKPLSARTHEFARGQPGDSLLQKLQLLFVSLEEEEAGLSVTQVAGRARAAFDIERVTKAFYRDFDAQRKAFLKFIDGIEEVADREWYASVMLNRLMFVYFIQRKGFLDGDPDYLRNRLARCQLEKGKDKFYSFYRYFLLRLFHEGFGQRPNQRVAGLEKLLGRIPYLNGGIFDVHELEKPGRYGKSIQIPDRAFERVFEYFDQYQWHLDERPLRDDDEINPDVLGYIFEKYINQKQMGAYYTKEDITEYISKNTVLPFLFETTKAKCRVAFENPSGPTVWDLLREDPDRYIYPAVRHGISWDIYANSGKGGALDAPRPLPPEIAIGVDTTRPDLIERRKAWNKPAPASHALPTEIWRETVARRTRCEEIRRKLAAGDVADINDLITLNLDIRQFAQDAIADCEGPDLLRSFWHAIEKVTILDPTCGSGAFLFAALNILEPLYEACLDRMEGLLREEADKVEPASRRFSPAGNPILPRKKFEDFTRILDGVAAHPNRRYFIFKSIILNNLFGVDIMEEAVEICKLRLFLKLAAQVEPDAAGENLGIEPLPDIDFNIRAGNTLVGYATYEEVKRVASGNFERAKSGSLDFDNAMDKISVKAADIQQTFDAFRQCQTEGDGSVPVEHKLELQRRLKALEDELNRHLAGEYAVKVSDKTAYARWVKSHQPFHWFIDFYGILHSGGFDVILGNPPYVEWLKIASYKPRGNYATLGCGNVYTSICERSYALMNARGRFGMIVPLSSVATDRMAAFRGQWEKHRLSTHASHYSGDAHPSILFNGVKFRLTILLQGKAQLTGVFSTHFQRWYAEGRDFVFPLIQHVAIPPLQIRHTLVPKTCSSTHSRILTKLCSIKTTLASSVREASAHEVYCHRIVAHFVKAMDFIPFFRSERDGDKKSEDYKVFPMDDQSARTTLTALLNSNLFYCWFVSYSDVYHCGREIILDFPVALGDLARAHGEQLGRITQRLMDDLRTNGIRRRIPYKTTGIVTYDEFYPRKSKSIIDEIDHVLAVHYGFTDEELDFILNFDIKYRLGRDAESDEE